MNLDFLTKIIIWDLDDNNKELGVRIAPDFHIKDMNHAVELIRAIEKCLSNCCYLTYKGYINQPQTNIPIVEVFIKFLGINNKNNNSLSIITNTLYYNLLLLLIYKILIIIERWLADNIDDLGCIDIKADLKNAKSNLMRMIHPSITKKLKNQGVSVLLNTIAGYDSEYELVSSQKMINKLLSIQIANCTSIYIKVPVIDTKSTRKMVVKVDNEYLQKKTFWNEKKLNQYCYYSMDTVIAELRDILYSENDNLIKDICLELTKIDKVSSYNTEDYILFTFPKNPVASMIKYVSEYTSVELIRDTEDLNNHEHYKSLLEFFVLLNKITGSDEVSDKMKDSILKSSNKPNSRISYRFGENNRLSITINRVLYLCMHESAADLSMLKDFDTFKEELDLIDRSFVTRGKPIIPEKAKSKLHIRDTILISPAGSKSLASVGNIYGGEFKKLDIGDYRGEGKMSKLLEDNKALFEEYALRDSLITLKHACSMEEFYLQVDRIGVPLTISGIGKAYVIKEWTRLRYEGYQVHKDITVGNLAAKITPKNARSIALSRHIVSFISAYRGGRNEAMMYGVDTIKDGTRQWYDYDLTSAYTTVMALLGHPDPSKTVRIFNKTVEAMPKEAFLFNYMSLEVDFTFPDNTKYPCIPTRVDDNVDIYPLKGHSVITGAEYWVAKSMGCRLYVKDGLLIPFDIIDLESLENKDITLEEWLKVYRTPYRSIVKELQSKRRKYPKKTFYNYLYKEIGNSIYGQVAMGVSGRTAYDIQSKGSVRLEGGVLSNPILASYITGFTRALVGECMNNISEMGGKVVGVTTDGFISDVKDLENKLLEKRCLNEDKTFCLSIYRELRKYLTTFKDVEGNAPEALEIKNTEELGLLSWKTRGNLGFTNGGISAATGFQAKSFDKDTLVNEFSKRIEEDHYNICNIEFIQSSLRGGRDIYKKGGHMVRVYRDRKFSLEFDNKRCIEANGLDNGGLLDSKPWNTINEYAKIRILKNTINNPIYTVGSVRGPSKLYKSHIETSVRAFIKACLHEIDDYRYGLPKGYFKSYQDIIKFIYGYESARVVKLTPSNISRLKNRDCISRAVPRTAENEGFINYVKSSFVDFECDRFFRELSSIKIRELKKDL